jgi:hypothetical protein
MMNDYIFQKGVVAYYRGSLAFSMIGHKLLLQGGAAYGEEGELLVLPQASYVILESTDLAQFENHQHYYFYIERTEKIHRYGADHFIRSGELEDGISFFISNQPFESAVLIGEALISHNGEEDSLKIAKNAFEPAVNELDLSRVTRVEKLPVPLKKADEEKFYEVFKTLAFQLQQIMVKTKHWELSTLVQAFLQSAENIRLLTLSPYQLYRMFVSSFQLFQWLESDLFKADIQVSIDELLEMVTQQRSQYKTDFYYFDLTEEESFFYQIIYKSEILCNLLMEEMNRIFSSTGTDAVLDGTAADHIIEENSPLDIVGKVGELDISESHITVIEEDEVEANTVLLSSAISNETDSIQVGRGQQSGNDIVIGENDKTVSRVHLRITAHEHGFFLEDLSSMGTYVNGERIDKNSKKFVTPRHQIVLGKKNCILDLNHPKIQGLLK